MKKTESFNAWRTYEIDLRKVLKLRPNETIEIVRDDRDILTVDTSEDDVKVKKYD